VPPRLNWSLFATPEREVPCVPTSLDPFSTRLAPLSYQTSIARLSHLTSASFALVCTVAASLASACFFCAFEPHPAWSCRLCCHFNSFCSRQLPSVVQALGVQLNKKADPSLTSVYSFSVPLTQPCLGRSRSVTLLPSPSLLFLSFSVTGHTNSFHQENGAGGFLPAA
jgi:hypothetical protein